MLLWVVIQREPLRKLRAADLSFLRTHCLLPLNRAGIAPAAVGQADELPVPGRSLDTRDASPAFS